MFSRSWSYGVSAAVKALQEEESSNRKIVLLIDMTKPNDRAEEEVGALLNLMMCTYKIIMALSSTFLAKQLDSSHLASTIINSRTFTSGNFTEETSVAFLRKLGVFTDEQAHDIYLLTNGIPRLLVLSNRADYKLSVRKNTHQLFEHVLGGMTVNGRTDSDVALFVACFFNLSLSEVDIDLEVATLCLSVKANLIDFKTVDGVIYPKCCFNITGGMLGEINCSLYRPYVAKKYYVNKAAVGNIFQSAVAGYLTKPMKIKATQMFSDRPTELRTPELKQITSRFKNQIEYTPPFIRYQTVLENDLLYNGHSCPGIDFVCVSVLNGVTIYKLQFKKPMKNRK